jgi:hypothetical protein
LVSSVFPLDRSLPVVQEFLSVKTEKLLFEKMMTKSG